MVPVSGSVRDEDKLFVEHSMSKVHSDSISKGTRI